MIFQKRTHTCGELRIENENQIVTLNGWISVLRDMGGLIFIDLRDRYGITQLVIEPNENPDLAERGKELRSEFVIWATGQVRKRENPNPKIPTGLIEILLSDFGIINRSELPPFEIKDDLDTSEELRLRYRYLDLRRHILQKNFITRHKLYQVVHSYFDSLNFIEVETPVLMKSTPEGARDFLVPSRINKGKFYALPQSPQIFKQILMISGFDRYVQIVKCFRDEDLRSDRQPEFTQIDIEMSFIDREDIFILIEGLFQKVWQDILGINISIPFPRLTYFEAMTRFGSDKPDTRFQMEIVTITELLKNCQFKVFADIINSGGEIALINAKGCAEFSRKRLDELTEFAKKYGAKGLAWIKLQNGEVSSPIAKYLDKNELDSIIYSANAKEGDLLLIVSDNWQKCYTVLGALRIEIAKQTGLLKNVSNQYEFLWVTDFPLLEFDVEENRYVSMHHPFTSPMDEDLEILESQPQKVRAKAYDIVVNGAEVGGGSIRIHDGTIQSRIFSLLGMSQAEAESKFGFLLDALKFGAPPHGGIALGLDRIVMTLCGTENIRDVIAFPKTTSGLSLMDGAPTVVDEKQLKDLGIKLINT